MDTKARPSRPRGNDDDEVIVVDTITEPADDADAAWPESPGLDVEEEPREYNFEVAVEGEEAEEDHAEKEKRMMVKMLTIRRRTRYRRRWSSKWRIRRRGVMWVRMKRRRRTI